MSTVVTESKTPGESAGERLLGEAFRREWDRLSLARAVAARLIAHRADHGLSQRELAARLGLRQSNVARLEAAAHVPSLDTLARIAGVLGEEFTISVAPADRAPGPLMLSAGEQVIASYEAAGATVRLAVG